MEIRLNLRDLTNPKEIEKLTSTISELADGLDIIYIESAPNGNISARQGRRCIYKNGSTYEEWINVDGSTTWQQIAANASLYALVANVVLLTGDQTVAGVKTFTSFPVTPSSAPTADYQAANKKYVDDSKVPTGAVLPFAGSSAPTGFLLCDGSAVSRTTYATLFALIGTTYGAGDTTTTFNVPNLKGKVPVGYNSAETEFDALGETGGEKTHQLTTTEMPSHTHVQGDSQKAANAGVTAANTLIADTDGGAAVSTAGAGSDGAHNNLQPYITLNYIIKT